LYNCDGNKQKDQLETNEKVQASNKKKTKKGSKAAMRHRQYAETSRKTEQTSVQNQRTRHYQYQLQLFLLGKLIFFFFFLI
jgi:hypothetical protein